MQRYGQFVWDFPFHGLGWQCKRTFQKYRKLLFHLDVWSGSMFNFGCVAEFLFCTFFLVTHVGALE